MYLSKIHLVNQGPIDEFQIEVTDPKQPIIIVGGNGSGKSTVLSYIVDALYELGKQKYNDLLGNISTDNYFRYSGEINRKSDAEYSFALLNFIDGTTKYPYVETTGLFDAQKYESMYRDILSTLNIVSSSKNIKATVNEVEKVGDVFKSNVICYFAPNRFEQPHWLNEEVNKKKDTFNLSININNRLRKPLVIEHMSYENQQWLLDVFLDSLMDIELNTGNFQISPHQNVQNAIVFRKSRDNVQKIIGEIVQNPNAVLALNDRRANMRLCIKDSTNDKVITPSIKHFSTGQAVLFNIFCTIIRYADIGNVDSSVVLDRIKGIVVIDEIDLHLHTDLQYTVLPKLIKQFPNIQFIITTHSPLFLLGMEAAYKELQTKPLIYEMPKGKKITSNKFIEFQKAYKFLKETETFENEFNEELEKQVKQVSESKKSAVLYVEGKTDVEHIKMAWNKLRTVEMPFDIFALNGADNIKQFLISYSQEQINKTVIGLVDYDEKGIKVISNLSKNFTQVNDNIFKRNNENGVNKDAYIITLPTPDENLAKYEYCPVEFLYEKELLSKYNMIEKRNLSKLNSIYFRQEKDYLNNAQFSHLTELWTYEVSEKSLSKNEFVDSIRNNSKLTASDFKNFEPLFVAISNIMKSDSLNN